MGSRVFVRKFLLDLVVWVSSPVWASLVRFDANVPSEHRPALLWLLALGVPLKAAVLLAFRLHRPAWRVTAFRDVALLGAAVAVAGVVEVAFGLMLQRHIPLSRGALLLSVVFGGIGLLALRAGARGAASWRRQRRRGATRSAPGRRAVVVGAGEVGSLVVREMRRHPEAGLTPVAILDDDPARRHLTVGGVPVVGPIADLPGLLRDGRADHVVLAIGSADGELVRRVNEYASEGGPGTEVKVVPGMYELLSGEVNATRLRPVQVEDLLRREPVAIDLAPVRGYLVDRTVMVTGGGGSIGSEIVRQLVQVGVGRVLALSHGEDGIFELVQALARRRTRVEVTPIIADVRDRERLGQVFAAHRPTVVFHAAAHKHVPLMEANPEQAVLNNVEGTAAVVDAARAFDVERLVNVSTDKAVNPSSVMGASKRLAECLVREAAFAASEPRTFVSVRFGNVLGSRGSVIPLFRQQIAAGGPVTVTDPRMTRYFMTIPEAVQLVLQAGALADPGAVYFLDMGQPVRIAQLAEDMIRLSGFQPHRDIDIVYTGVRPGEKLFEELVGDAEHARPTAHSKVFATQAPDLRGAALHAVVDEVLRAARRGDTERLVALLHEALASSPSGPRSA